MVPAQLQYYHFFFLKNKRKFIKTPHEQQENSSIPLFFRFSLVGRVLLRAFQQKCLIFDGILRLHKDFQILLMGLEPDEMPSIFDFMNNLYPLFIVYLPALSKYQTNLSSSWRLMEHFLMISMSLLSTLLFSLGIYQSPLGVIEGQMFEFSYLTCY